MLPHMRADRGRRALAEHTLTTQAVRAFESLTGVSIDSTLAVCNVAPL